MAKDVPLPFHVREEATEQLVWLAKQIHPTVVNFQREYSTPAFVLVTIYYT